MTRRQREIVLLLGAILDAPFAQPKSWTSELVRRNAVRGEVPANRVPCPACNGQKMRRVRTVLMPCDRCLGSKGKPLGYIVVDGMIDERYRRKIATAETRAEIEEKLVTCDVCGGRGRTLAPQWRGEADRCEQCRGGGVVPVKVTRWRAARCTIEVEIREPAGDPIIGAMEARSSGSFDELAAALEALREAWPALYRLTLRRYVRGEDLGQANERVERLGLAFLEPRMPDPVLVPGWVRRRQEVAAA